MRILFLGNANSPLLSNLARELSRNQNWTIDIISDYILSVPEHSSCYNKVYALDHTKWYRRMKFVRTIGYAIQCRGILAMLLRNGIKYDYVHIFFIYPSYGLLVKKIAAITEKIFISVFGSDYYRTSAIEKWLQGYIVRRADLVLAANPRTLSDFSEHYAVPLDKREVRVFGLTSLEYLNKLQSSSRKSLRNLMGIDRESLAIAVGYNASENQNHFVIIKELIKVRNLLPGNVVLLVPLMTGGTNKYKDEIEKELRESGFTYLLFREFLSDDKLAALRYSSDVLIQIQNRDQLSGAMLEHLFAGSTVITGSWLPYDVLKTNHVFYYTIDEFDDLGAALLKAIAEREVTEQVRKKNKDYIWQICGWENARKLWSDLYDKK